jgi:type I restriction enzyme S subunit
MMAMQNSKDSGLDWFGFIPEHWQILPMKLLLEKIYSGGTPTTTMSEFWTDNEDGINWVAISDITKSKGILTETAKKITQKGLESKNLEIIPKGTLLLSIFASLGKTTTLGIDSTVNQAIIGLQPNSKLNQKFLQYLFEDCERYINYYSSANTQENLNVSKIKDLVFPVPPVSEQVKIAAFLDQKTAQIDTIIEKKQKLLQLLDEKKKSVINEAVTKGLNPNVPMKDSGIEWIGDIPESWQVTKIKYCSALQGRIGFKGYSKDDIVTADEGALTLGAKHINKKNELDLYSPEYLSWEKYFESPEIMVNVGDIIFTQRGSLGKVCIIEHNIGEATINPSMVILRTYPNINSKFLYNWLTADYIQNNVNLIQSNTAVPMISQFQLGNFEVLAPSLKEQEEINEFIESYKEGSNVLSKKVLIQIEKLIEYRQSLISEAVTGKINLN